MKKKSVFFPGLVPLGYPNHIEDCPDLLPDSGNTRSGSKSFRSSSSEI